MHMTHRMMNVALMTSNDDIESSSSTTTTKKRQSGKKLYTAGILNEKLTIFHIKVFAFLMNNIKVDSEFVVPHSKLGVCFSLLCSV